MSNWIDFKALRRHLDFERVLAHYGVEVKRWGGQHLGFCPLPDHKGRKNSPSFSANLKRGIFQCFGCGAKGNALEFAALMEQVDLHDGTAFRELALEVQRRFCPETIQLDDRKAEPAKAKPKEAETTGPTDAPALVNAPLDFELKGLDAAHPYLLGRGFKPDTIAHFGLGYCSRGLLKGRIAIPLQDTDGQLIGYAGRVVDDSTVNEDTPRYRFPGTRERSGQKLEFRKSVFLYNGHRLREPVADLLMVEGFASVWWLHQLGRTNVVATMGADCSARQAELIVALLQPTGRVWLMPDGDEAGERFAHTALPLLAAQRFVRWVRLPKGKQPTDLSAEALQACCPA